MTRKKKPEDQIQAGPANSRVRRIPATKTEAVEVAIAAGFDSPQIGSGYIQSQFGLEVSPQYFSSTKSQLKSKMLEVKPERKQKPKASVEGDLTPPQKISVGALDPLAAVERMKPLVVALGVDRI